MIRLNEYKGIYIDEYCYDADDIDGMFRLQMELYKHEGIIATIEECINIWHNHSSDLAANWLSVPENNLVQQIKAQYQFTSFEEYSKP